MSIVIQHLFIKTPIYRKPGKEKIIMKIKGLLVDIMVQMDMGNHGPNLV